MTRPYGLPDMVIYGFMRHGVAKKETYIVE
jgi:hypothetical protein